ncbi:MAG: ABC transporter transmembrane domain-containing protein [Pseudomonadota bacterium]
MFSKEEQPKEIIRFLYKYLKEFRLQIYVILFSIAIISSAILGLGYALKYLIDQGFLNTDFDSLNKGFALLILLVLLLAFASYNRSLRTNLICEQLENKIKKDAYKNIIKVSPSYFELNKISDILSRLSTDLTLLSNSIVMIASFSLRNALMAMGGLFLLIYTSPKLSLYVLIILPLILIPLIFIGRKVKRLSKENQSMISISNAHLEESLSFIKIVQSYTQEEFEIKRFFKSVDQSQNIARERIKLRAILFALVIALILSSVSFVLWIGGRDVLYSNLSAGELSSFVFYAILVATSIGALSEVFSDWQRAAGALERIIEVLNAKSNITEAELPLSLSENFDLEVKHLSFTYPSRPNIKVLDDISFKAKKGNIIAIIGPSGAGKSTIFSLLLRFLDPDSGTITLGGIDIKDLSFKELRSQFALVTQDPVIFSDTAYNNILYGKQEATESEVVSAAKSAEIFDFFNSLPEGLNTYLGEKGVKLSGGQKQRIAISRAILKDPKILLLDEATSSLDAENEKLVQLALDNLKHNRTTLVISHHMSSIANVDLIIHLENGKIVSRENT